MSLRAQFGDIDIYLFDLLLRERIVPGMRVLEAGCGGGRNLVYLLREGYDVTAVDAAPDAVAAVRALARRLAPQLPEARFRVEAVESMTVPPGSADVVISSAVLHFARDERHFEAMLHAVWEALAPGGLLFCRLATSTGLQTRIIPRGNGRYLLPDGSERFLVSEERLEALTTALGGTLVDPIKSTVVQGMRSMGTWVVRRPA